MVGNGAWEVLCLSSEAFQWDLFVFCITGTGLCLVKTYNQGELSVSDHRIPEDGLEL